EGEIKFEELQEKDKEKQKQERWEKIRVARYNRWYGWVKGEGIPAYLEKGWGERRWRRVVRFRLGNEMREGRYWEGEEGKKCRLCGSGVESWEHVWKECRSWRIGLEGEWQEVVHRILEDEGEGEGWMREVEEERRKMEESVGVRVNEEINEEDIEGEI
ncbi:hypothetical protein ALC57_11811, partial [Trachymyrmex cornetzi]